MSDMTRKEAIRHLHTFSTTMGSGQTSDEQHKEAKRMAIEALSAEATDVYKAHEEEHLKIVNRIKELQYAIAKTQTIVGELVVSAEAEWIPCSERLPENSGDYLVCPSDGVIEDYSDFRDVMIMPYDADCEAFGWWTERYDPISLGFVDSDFNEFEVLAWMPLPKPYREDGEA